MTDVPETLLIALAPAAIDALAARDLPTANRLSGLELSPYFISDECLSVWRYRSAQLRIDPAAAEWITRIVVDPIRDLAVGRAGYHGPPDADGLVEVGYSIDPAERRKGYARSALEHLFTHARVEASVTTVRASVRPDNNASLALIEQYGFVAVGEQWDEEDGLETILEVSV